jgi:hypothetical protein
VLAAVSLLVLLAGCATRGESDHRAGAAGGHPPTASAPASSTTPAADGPETYLGLPVEPARSAHVLDDHTAGGMLLAQSHPNRLWVGGSDGLWWIDPGDEAVHKIDSKPGVGVFLRGTSLYRAAYYEGDVARYDASGRQARETARTQAPAPLYGLGNGDGVWVTDHTGGRLLQLDPTTLGRQTTLQLGPRSGGYHHALAGLATVGRHTLWVVSERDQQLYEIDTRRATVVDRIGLDARPTDQLVPAGDDRLWVMLSRLENPEHADLELVDTSTGMVVTRVVAHDDAFQTRDTEELTGAAPVVVDGEVWVPADEHLVHLDATNGWRPDRVLALPMPGMMARFAAVASGSLWVYSGLPENLIVRVPLDELTGRH